MAIFQLPTVRPRGLPPIARTLRRRAPGRRPPAQEGPFAPVTALGSEAGPGPGGTSPSPFRPPGPAPFTPTGGPPMPPVRDQWSDTADFYRDFLKAADAEAARVGAQKGYRQQRDREGKALAGQFEPDPNYANAVSQLQAIQTARFALQRGEKKEAQAERPVFQEFTRPVPGFPFTENIRRRLDPRTGEPVGAEAFLGSSQDPAALARDRAQRRAEERQEADLAFREKQFGFTQSQAEADRLERKREFDYKVALNDYNYKLKLAQIYGKREAERGGFAAQAAQFAPLTQETASERAFQEAVKGGFAGTGFTSAPAPSSSMVARGFDPNAPGGSAANPYGDFTPSGAPRQGDPALAQNMLNAQQANTRLLAATRRQALYPAAQDTIRRLKGNPYALSDDQKAALLRRNPDGSFEGSLAPLFEAGVEEAQGLDLSALWAALQPLRGFGFARPQAAVFAGRR